MALSPRLFTIGVPLCLSVALLHGCGPRNFDNENDRLRAEVLELQRSVDQLQQQLELREGELEATRQQLDEGPRPVEGARPPQLGQLRLDRYSGAVDTDDDGTRDTVRLYVRPVDARGRFLPVAGRAVLQVVTIQPGEEPRVLAERVYTPDEWEAAYRSGFTGTHFTLETELPDDLPQGADEATAKLTFTEAATGAEFTAQQAVQLRE